MGSDWTSASSAAASSRPRSCRAWSCARSRPTPRRSSASRCTRAVITVPGLFQRPAAQGHHQRRPHRRPAGRAHLQRADRRRPGLRLPRGAARKDAADLRPRRRHLRRFRGRAIRGRRWRCAPPPARASWAARISRAPWPRACWRCTGMPFERTELEAPQLVSRLIQQCELAKCRLSRQDSAVVRVPDQQGEFHDDSHGSDGHARPVGDLDHATSWPHRAADSPGAGRRQAEARGRRRGAPRRRRHAHAAVVIDRVTDLLGKPPQRRLNPDEVVALGAAVQAGLIAREESVERPGGHRRRSVHAGRRDQQATRPRTPRRLFPAGHRPQHHDPGEPGRSVCQHAASQPDRRSWCKIYQGEGRRVEDNLFLGEFELSRHPTRPGRPGRRRPLHLRPQRRPRGGGDASSPPRRRSATSSPGTRAACPGSRSSRP